MLHKLIRVFHNLTSIDLEGHKLVIISFYLFIIIKNYFNGIIMLIFMMMMMMTMTMTMTMMMSH